MKKKILRTIFSFLIIALHSALFGSVQSSETFASTQIHENWTILKMILYTVGITFSVLHPCLTNLLGQRRVLVLGLIADAMGFLCFLIHHFVYHPLIFIMFYVGTAFFGIASLSVLNCLIIYMIWDYPKNTVIGITALIAFANVGFSFDAVSGIAINWLRSQTEFFLFVISLLLFFAATASIIFDDTPYPIKEKGLRSGSLLWKEMHKRLFFFLLVVILYAATEATYNCWGFDFLEHKDWDTHAPLSYFWIAMILGQFFLLIPLAYGNPYKILFGKVGLIVLSLLVIPFFSTEYFVASGFFLGGLGCAGIFPVVLAMLEVELIQVSLRSRYPDYVPLIDSAISIMTAGYLFGIALIDFGSLFYGHKESGIPFGLAIVYILGACVLLRYLNRTRTAQI